MDFNSVLLPSLGLTIFHKNIISVEADALIISFLINQMAFLSSFDDVCSSIVYENNFLAFGI